jgi:hypothetical protein
MKTTIVTAIILLTTRAAWAQRPDFSATCKEQMKQLAYLAGDWQGEARVTTPSGKLTIAQSEHIEWKMDGLVLSIEGTGREQGKVAFQAFALVNYDPIEKRFKMKSFVKEGFATDAYFTVLAPNRFEWGFDIATGGKTRYTIVLDPEKKTWQETGEYSRDRNTWMSFIDLTLTKQ